MYAELVAIINVTPDSFSDGGAALRPEHALTQVRRSFAEGAAVVDIGAQSTRPGARWISASEEWNRLAPVLDEAVAIARQCHGRISVDTFHPEVAAKALEAGVDWINDVTGFENPEMVAVVRGSACSLVVMHALGVPPNPALTLDSRADVVSLLLHYFQNRLHSLLEAGIEQRRLIFDPGIGFGKSPMQSLSVLLRMHELTRPNIPLLVGHSRKSFLKLFSAAEPEDRDDLTLAFSSLLATQSVRYLRVHNVLRHASLLSAMDANMPHN